MAHSTARKTDADSPAPSAIAPPSSNLGIDVHRTACAVQITVTAQNEYVAIEIFDRVVKSLESGSLRLDISKAR